MRVEPLTGRIVALPQEPRHLTTAPRTRLWRICGYGNHLVRNDIGVAAPVRALKEFSATLIAVHLLAGCLPNESVGTLAGTLRGARDLPTGIALDT